MKITVIQYDSLVTKIYETLMAMPDMGMGEMGEAKDTASSIVDEWMSENGFELDEQIDSEGLDVTSERSVFRAMEGGTDGG